MQLQPRDWNDENDITVTGGLKTLTLIVKHPCTDTTADLPDIEVNHYVGIQRTTYISWKLFTWDHPQCNNGENIPFPSAY
jgi:hypothetical protein